MCSFSTTSQLNGEQRGISREYYQSSGITLEQMERKWYIRHSDIFLASPDNGICLAARRDYRLGPNSSQLNLVAVIACRTIPRNGGNGHLEPPAPPTPRRHGNTADTACWGRSTTSSVFRKKNGSIHTRTTEFAANYVSVVKSLSKPMWSVTMLLKRNVFIQFSSV